MSLQIMQSVCTKPRIYLTYGSYLGTSDELIFFVLLNKLYMIHLTERYKFNSNNKTIEALQSHVGLFKLMLLLLSFLLCLSRFVFDMYFSPATCFFNLVISTFHFIMFFCVVDLN